MVEGTVPAVEIVVETVFEVETAFSGPVDIDLASQEEFVSNAILDAEVEEDK